MAQHLILTITISLLGMLSQAKSANILMLFTVPSLNNPLMYRPIIETLAARNHSIVIVTTDPSQDSFKQWPNVEEIDLHDVSYSVWRNNLAAYARELLTSNDKLSFHRMFTLMSIDIAEAQLSSPVMKSIVNSKKQKFDVVMGSIVHLADLAVAAKYGAPFIGIHQSDLINAVHYYLGNSFEHAYHPDEFYPHSRSLQSLQGFEDRYYESRLHSMLLNASVYVDRVIQKHLKIKIKSIELLENADLIMLTTDPIWSAPRPLRPNTLFIGDTHFYDAEALNNETQEFLDKASEGAVYFNLGTNEDQSSLSNNRLQVILEALKHVPYRVLLKWDTKKLAGAPSNVLTATSFPQQSALAHPNMKVFVTQGGLLSISQAVYNEVPLVMIPLIENELSNAVDINKLGLGVQVDLLTMTSKDLSEAIINVATNISYMSNVQALAERLFDQQKSAVDSAVWWVEYLIRHKSGSHYQYPKISTIEYLFIDVIFIILLAVVVLVVLLYMLILLLANKYCRRNRLDMSKRFIFAPSKNK